MQRSYIDYYNSMCLKFSPEINPPFCTIHCFISRRLCLQTGTEITSARDLLHLWQRESWWCYSGLLSSQVDRERYRELTSHALRKHFNTSDLVSGTSIICTGSGVLLAWSVVATWSVLVVGGRDGEREKEREREREREEERERGREGVGFCQSGQW